MAGAFAGESKEHALQALHDLARNTLNGRLETAIDRSETRATESRQPTDLSQTQPRPAGTVARADAAPGAQIQTARATALVGRRVGTGMREPSRPTVSDDDSPEDRTLSRSDRIAVGSIIMALVILALRYRYPDFAREMAVEFRYMLGLVASCFMLGISGWFEIGNRGVTKLQASFTILALLAMMGIWELLLSGSLAPTASRITALIATVLR